MGEDGSPLPGSAGEHTAQEEFGTATRALAFYEDSMHEELTDRMAEFVSERILCFLATADAEGHTDCSPRLGPKGFVNVLDANTLAYPEYRGNGVHASLGNIRENPHATLLFVDWWETTVGLHINGTARLRESIPGAEDPSGTDRVKTWVELDVEEAYIHCAKHLPQLRIEAFDPPWGTDDETAKRAGFFEAEE